MTKEYPWWTPYQFAANTPISALDNDGRRVYFVAGAGNDALGWNYVERFRRIFTKQGINGFTRINASHDFQFTQKMGLPPIGDITFTTTFRGSRFRTYPHPDIAGQTFTIKVTDRQIVKAVNSVIQDMNNNPLAEGEQLNLSGYSYGSVLQAHVALALVEKGFKVDNLILIGSPISDDSDLFKELKKQMSAGNIGQVIREDIPGDKLSNPSSLQDFWDGAEQNSTDAGPHFDLARPDNPFTPNVNEEKQANKRIEKLANRLKSKGVN